MKSTYIWCVIITFICIIYRNREEMWRCCFVSTEIWPARLPTSLLLTRTPGTCLGSTWLITLTNTTTARLWWAVGLVMYSGRLSYSNWVALSAKHCGTTTNDQSIVQRRTVLRHFKERGLCDKSVKCNLVCLGLNRQLECTFCQSNGINQWWFCCLGVS